MRRLATAVAVLALSLTVGIHSGGHAAAANWVLSADQSCNATPTGSVSAMLSWSTDWSTATQWVDISDSNNGWQPGTYTSIPAAPFAASQILTGLKSSSTYYVEIGQIFPDGTWVYSPTRALDVRDCLSVPARTTPYGAFFGQNPGDGPRVVKSMDQTDGVPGTTITVSKPKNTSSSGGSGDSGSSSSTNGSGGANNCGVPTKSGSIVQSPLNASANGVSSISGC